MVEITRGSVVVIGKPVKGLRRFAVIIQSDAFAPLPSVLVAPLTFDEVDAPLLRVRLDSSDTLPMDSTAWIMVELVTAIPRTLIGTKIGHITPEQQRELDRALIVISGIA